MITPDVNNPSFVFLRHLQNLTDASCMRFLPFAAPFERPAIYDIAVQYQSFAANVFQKVIEFPNSGFPHADMDVRKEYGVVANFAFFGFAHER
jgi:hypothetical protein